MSGSSPDGRTPADDAYKDDFESAADIPVRYAFIGEGIGVVLIYLGTRIPYRILSWPIIGIGISFLFVMTAHIIAVAWGKSSPSIHRFVSRLRGPGPPTRLTDPKAGIRHAHEAPISARKRPRRPAASARPAAPT